jgi:siroheme synthase
VSSAVLALARREAERIDVGQLGSQGGWSFESVVGAVAECAKKGHRACLVRAGDPYANDQTQEVRSLLEAGLRVAVMRPAPA